MREYSPESTTAEPAIERRSLAEQVYSQIKTLILSGELKGGERVSEEGLAERFHLSRTPVREAMRRLEQYGLLRIKPRSYAEVADLSNKEAEDIVTVRLQLETLAVRLLAQHASPRDIQTLKALSSQCVELLEADDVAGVFEKDSEFHMEITRCAGNRALLDIMERFDARVQLVRLMRCSTRDTIAQNLVLHDELIDALRLQDAEHASELMTLHVLGFKGSSIQGRESATG